MSSSIPCIFVTVFLMCKCVHKSACCCCKKFNPLTHNNSASKLDLTLKSWCLQMTQRTGQSNPSSALEANMPRVPSQEEVSSGSTLSSSSFLFSLTDFQEYESTSDVFFFQVHFHPTVGRSLQINKYKFTQYTETSQKCP